MCVKMLVMEINGNQSCLFTNILQNIHRRKKDMQFWNDVEEIFFY